MNRVARAFAVVALCGLPLAAVISAAPADASPVPVCSGMTCTITFAYNGTDGTDGSPQVWMVPNTVTSATFDVLGASGSGTFGAGGGLGGEATATLAVSPGSQVTVVVAARRQHRARFKPRRASW
jgi:hypothetical protein